MSDEANFEGWFPHRGDHRTVGRHRAWCECRSWCYPTEPCMCCAEPLYELEIDRLAVAVEEKSAYAERMDALAEERLIEIDRLAAAVERVRGLHYEGGAVAGFCHQCGFAFPCPTRAALEGSEDRG